MPSVKAVSTVVVLIVFTSLAVNWDRVSALMEARFADVTPDGAGPVHYIREGLVAALIVMLVHGIVRHERKLIRTVTISTPVFLFAGYVIVAAARTLGAGFPPEYLLYGVRPLLFAIVIAAVRHYPTDALNRVMLNLARWCKPFLLVQVGFAVYQIFNSPPFFGATFLGARPWGTFSAPNNLGVACLAIALLMLIMKPKRWLLWFGIASAVILVCGTRTSLMWLAAIVAVAAVRRIPGSALFIPAGLVLGSVLLLFVSSEEVSGRSIEGEGRLTNWGLIFQDMSPVEIIFGRVLGAGTNAAYLVDAERFDVPVSDSQIVATVSSLGVIGILVVLGAMVHLWRISHRDQRPFVFVTLIITGLTFNIAEYYPANMLLALMAGFVCVRCAHQSPGDHMSGNAEIVGEGVAARSARAG